MKASVESDSKSEQIVDSKSEQIVVKKRRWGLVTPNFLYLPNSRKMIWRVTGFSEIIRRKAVLKGTVVLRRITP